jgi:hypothetical protein
MAADAPLQRYTAFCQFLCARLEFAAMCTCTQYPEAVNGQPQDETPKSPLPITVGCSIFIEIAVKMEQLS